MHRSYRYFSCFGVVVRRRLLDCAAVSHVGVDQSRILAQNSFSFGPRRLMDEKSERPCRTRCQEA